MCVAVHLKSRQFQDKVPLAPQFDKHFPQFVRVNQRLPRHVERRGPETEGFPCHLVSFAGEREDQEWREGAQEVGGERL